IITLLGDEVAHGVNRSGPAKTPDLFTNDLIRALRARPELPLKLLIGVEDRLFQGEDAPVAGPRGRRQLSLWQRIRLPQTGNHVVQIVARQGAQALRSLSLGTAPRKACQLRPDNASGEPAAAR